ncbi:MAG TPA: hypothetical protein VKU82_12095 [Planctomycetaceae bacterium]|nr:hypothetical protein [Planctomycetaceae bacterium]
MLYLYGAKFGTPRKLVATFGSEQQLLDYVAWATLGIEPGGTAKFEQRSALATYHRCEKSSVMLTDEDPTTVAHNP